MTTKTVENSSIQRALCSTGLCQLKALYSEATLKHWNSAIDLYLDPNANSARHYLDAADLFRIGILDSLFSATLLQVIEATLPNAALFHLHMYQTPPSDKPHIHSDNGLNGWHRDDDCLYAWRDEQADFFSLFIYLTDVDENAGAFEIAPRSANQRLANRQSCFRVTGPIGTNFLFNRTHWHRATPNRSNTERRVLKLSFQSHYLYNDRLAKEEFAPIRASHLMNNPILRQWFQYQEVYHGQRAN